MHASIQGYSLVDERYLVICCKITSTKRVTSARHIYMLWPKLKFSPILNLAEF